jgi:hypothetical protein
MSSHVFPLPAGVLSQPNLTVFPGGVSVAPAPSIIQLAQQECSDIVGNSWRTPSSGAGVGTEGAWNVHILSTIRENTWFGICFSNNLDFGDALLDRFAEFDIGVGAAGLEVPFLDDLGFSWLGNVSGGAALGVMYTGAFVTPIPLGSRVSVRCKDDQVPAISYRSLLFLMSE